MGCVVDQVGTLETRDSALGNMLRPGVRTGTPDAADATHSFFKGRVGNVQAPVSRVQHPCLPCLLIERKNMSQKILLKEWEEYSKLRMWIIWQDHLYYGLDSPEVSDRVYDRELKRLEKMEEKFSYFVTSDSPTQIPGHDRFCT